jgi:hypothetical protein
VSEVHSKDEFLCLAVLESQIQKSESEGEPRNTYNSSVNYKAGVRKDLKLQE